jgi:hypothetical protein
MLETILTAERDDGRQLLPFSERVVLYAVNAAERRC